MGQTSTELTMSLSTSRRVRFEVDLTTHRWQATTLPQATQVTLKGTGAATTALTQQSDGAFAATLTLPQGTLSWSLDVQAGGQTTSWTPQINASRAFPQGGNIMQGSAPGKVEIPSPGGYRISIWHDERRWQIQSAERGSGVASWDAQLAKLQAINDPATRATQARQWLAQRAALGLLPLRTDQAGASEVVFIVEWKTQGPVYLAGSFNQWSTSASPMQQLTGTDVWYRKQRLNAGHHEYKFVNAASPQVWILDPNNTGFVYGGLGPNSALQVGTTTKHILHWHPKVAATRLNNTRDVFVYLPPGYDADPTRRYPVIYMHDGQNLFDPKAINGGWDVAGTMDSLLSQKQIQPAIIVGMANTPGRMNEYSHTKDRIGGQSVGGDAKDYADFILSDLKPWIDGLYRTAPDRRSTGTMGSSMGGLISLWLGYAHPEAFFRIGALSSTFGWGQIGASNPTLIDTFGSASSWRNFVVYIDSGSPNDNYGVTIQMRDLLEKIGYLHDLNLRHWVQQGAAHNEVEWRKRLHRPLTFLLKWR